MGVYKRNRMWYYVFFHKGKRYQKSAGPSKKDAEIALGRAKKKIADGTFGIESPLNTTFEEFAPIYIKWSEQNKRSYKRDVRLVNNLEQHFKYMELEKLTTADVQDYKDARFDGVIKPGKVIAGPSTVNRELSCLRRMLNLALELKKITKNPLQGKIKMMKESGERDRYLSPVEAKKVLSFCAEHIRPVVDLALCTGMRKEEILGLKWEEVHLEQGVIKLPGEKIVNGRKVSRTKNGKPREIPISKRARSVLLRAWQNRLEGSNLVFHKRDGSHLGSIRNAFIGACRRAGIMDLKFHDLRHTFCTAVIRRGVSFQIAGEIVGHGSIYMTLRYSHVAPEQKKHAVEQAALYLDGEKPDRVHELRSTTTETTTPDVS